MGEHRQRNGGVRTGRGECWRDYMSPGETRTSRVECPTISNDGREMGFEAPRRHGSSKDSLADPRRHDLNSLLPRRRVPGRIVPRTILEHAGHVQPGALRRGRGKKKEQKTRRMPVGLHGFSPPGRGFESRRACHGPVAQLVRAGNVRSIPRRREPYSKLANAGGTTGRRISQKEMEP